MIGYYTYCVQRLDDRFQGPPDPIANSRIHLWHAVLDSNCIPDDRIESSVPRKELEGIKYIFYDDRKRYLRARAFLRSVLGQYLHMEPKQILFSRSPLGKPIIDISHHNRDICFNMSTSDHVALVGISLNIKLGVDIESIRNRPFSHHEETLIFSDSELRRIDASEARSRGETTIRSWTAKEAYLKAVGCGLYYPPNLVDVLIRNEKPIKIFAAAKCCSLSTITSLIHFDPVPGYAASAVSIE